MSDRIIYFSVENAKSITFAEGRPGDVNVVGGANASGKSSLMQTLAGLLGGGKYLPPEPVKQGCRISKTKIETENYIATMVVPKRGQPKWKVEAKDGGNIPTTAHKFLKSLVGDSKMFSDMNYFMALDTKKQVDFIKDLVGIDTTEIDVEYKEVYNQRTGINKTIKEKDGLVNEINFDPTLPDKEINSEVLLEEYDNAVKIQQRKDFAINSIKHQHKVIKEAIEELVDWEDVIEELPEVHIEAIKMKMVEVTSLNKRIMEQKTRDRAVQERNEFQTASDNMTEQLKEITEAKQRMLAGCKLPKGLTITTDGMEWHGRIFDKRQLSSSEMLNIMVEVAFATLPEDKLRVVFIDGSYFDESAIGGLYEVAQRCDGQIFMEIPTLLKELCRFYFKEGTMEQIKEER